MLESIIIVKLEARSLLRILLATSRRNNDLSLPLSRKQLLKQCTSRLNGVSTANHRFAQCGFIV